jgi:hypothetical protein
MIIKLIRTGGLIPLTKTAETDIEISDQELSALLEKIQTPSNAPRIKDGTTFSIVAGSKTIAVDLDKVPPKFQALFSKLKNDLKITKT